MTDDPTLDLEARHEAIRAAAVERHNAALAARFNRPRVREGSFNVGIWDSKRQGTALSTNVFRKIRRQYERDYLSKHGHRPSGRQWAAWRTAQRRLAREESARELGRFKSE